MKRKIKNTWNKKLLLKWKIIASYKTVKKKKKKPHSLYASCLELKKNIYNKKI